MDRELTAISCGRCGAIVPRDKAVNGKCEACEQRANTIETRVWAGMVALVVVALLVGCLCLYFSDL